MRNAPVKKLLLCLALSLLPGATMAQGTDDWPKRQVWIVVPFAAGSTPDLLARTMADKLAAKLGQQFLIENKPGAGGMIGTEAIAKAEPDGYRIGVSITGPLVNNKLLYKRMPYDPFTDLAPISWAVSQPCVLVAASNFPAANLQETLAALKSKPGAFNYASFGNGTVSHLSMELVAARSGTKIVQVPYPGSGQAVAALLAGEVSLGCMPPGTVIGHVRAGKLKAIGVAAAKRSTIFPEIPTLAEQGLPGVEANAWIGVVAPAKVPAPLLARISREVIAALRDPGTVETMRKAMMEIVGSTPDELAQYMQSELARWKPIVEANKISAD
jgi:tripartite-type tricarboxylate transporter receptor subunit TctC